MFDGALGIVVAADDDDDDDDDGDDDDDTEAPAPPLEINFVRSADRRAPTS